jgi:hypothetical protein
VDLLKMRLLPPIEYVIRGPLAKHT